ncbi:MAG: hypothetical protein H7338_11265 [Candidatus Sericytochromatia bacterium]|nr:hypothetical protein [Candidatus Sericytochromatia bacterium]
MLVAEHRCPKCHDRPLTRHSSGLRWVYTIAERFQIVVFRLRCRPCRLTATLLPETLVPYHRYAAVIIEAAVTRSLTAGSSCRRVAIALVAPDLPADQNQTDALLSVSLKPSYQRIHAWLDRITDLAPDYTTALVTWVLRLKPESPLLPHLSVPLDAVPPALKPVALLVHLLAVVGESADWLPTLNRFVLRIAGMIPWRRPPPGLPQSSGRVPG